MNLNQAGIDLIKKFEACSLLVYQDLVGLHTVGWGHRTFLPLGEVIDQQKAEELLTGDLASTCTAMKGCITMDLNDNEFSAIVSLAFNVGVNAIKQSTLIKLVNGGGLIPASNEFEKWSHAGGKEVPGLLRRRLAEKALFLS